MWPNFAKSPIWAHLTSKIINHQIPCKSLIHSQFFKLLESFEIFLKVCSPQEGCCEKYVAVAVMVNLWLIMTILPLWKWWYLYYCISNWWKLDKLQLPKWIQWRTMPRRLVSTHSHEYLYVYSICMLLWIYSDNVSDCYIVNIHNKW